MINVVSRRPVPPIDHREQLPHQPVADAGVASAGNPHGRAVQRLPAPAGRRAHVARRTRDRPWVETRFGPEHRPRGLVPLSGRQPLNVSGRVNSARLTTLGSVRIMVDHFVRRRGRTGRSARPNEVGQGWNRERRTDRGLARVGKTALVERFLERTQGLRPQGLHNARETGGTTVPGPSASDRHRAATHPQQSGSVRLRFLSRSLCSAR